MESTEDRLFNLLPAIYRQRDAENGHGLRAILRVMESELQCVQEDIETLYENWFVDTCQEWVLPYIGEVLGVRDLIDERSVIESQRRRIANTIRYRRRKGIGFVLENVVFDVTGWPTRLVEFTDSISMTQTVSSIRSGKGKILDIRNCVAMEQLGGPFDSNAHLLDVRSICSDANRSAFMRGRHGILNVGLFLWRLQCYSATGRSAIPCAGSVGGYRFNSLGFDTPLFNRPESKGVLAAVSDATRLPVALTRNMLRSDLNEYKRVLGTGASADAPAVSTFYGPGRSLNVRVNGSSLTPDKVVSCDLTHWAKEAVESSEVFGERGLMPCVGVDVERGRLLFSEAFLRGNKDRSLDVVVDYHYAFSADMGGGQYDRSSTLVDDTVASRVVNLAVGTDVDSLEKALSIWHEHCEETRGAIAFGIIRILDDAVYTGDTPIVVPSRSHLVIEAVDGRSPFIRCANELVVVGPAEQSAGASLVFSGVGVNSTVRISSGCLGLSLRHCTIMSEDRGGHSAASIVADPGVFDTSISISHCLLGPIHVSADTATSLHIRDSIVDERGTGLAIGADLVPDGWGPSLVLERVTIFGEILARELVASESILNGVVGVERRQGGYIRFSYAAPGSRLPMRFRCQPDLEDTLGIRPHFTSIRYGTPGYGQLSHLCPESIRRGAKDGSEMGAFQSLRQSQREEGVKAMIHEYLRQDMEAGIFYVT